MKSASSPNIVLLHAHDAGRWCSPYGVPVDTPHLAAFAREGVLFRRAFAAAPTCAPARAALFTGLHPHQIGMFGLPGPQGWRIDDYRRHLVHRLNEAGYHTVLAGCQHEAPDADLSPLGYAEILNRPGRLDGQCYPETIIDVEQFLARRQQRPFFLSFGVDEPHNDNLARPELRLHGKADRHSKTRYYDPQKLDTRFVAPPPHLPDLPEIRREMASLATGVRIMDEYFGRVLWALRHYDYEADTLVIITTDHGPELPGGKMTLSDFGLGVMLLIRGPGGFSGGRIFDDMVSHLDLYPTVCAQIGRPPPPDLAGRDSSLLVNGRVRDGELHYELFGEQTYHEEPEPLRSIRTDRYKLVLRHFTDGPRLVETARPPGSSGNTAGTTAALVMSSCSISCWIRSRPATAPPIQPTQMCWPISPTGLRSGCGGQETHSPAVSFHGRLAAPGTTFLQAQVQSLTGDRPAAHVGRPGPKVVGAKAKSSLFSASQRGDFRLSCGQFAIPLARLRDGISRPLQARSGSVRGFVRVPFDWRGRSDDRIGG